MKSKNQLIALFIIVLVVLMITGGILATAINSTNPSPGKKVIEINTKKFKFNKETIRLKEGDQVELLINNTDIPHGIMIPDLNLSGMDKIEFQANKKGRYKFYCANPHCGFGHEYMEGEIIIE